MAEHMHYLKVSKGTGKETSVSLSEQQLQPPQCAHADIVHNFLVPLQQSWHFNTLQTQRINLLKLPCRRE